MLEGSSSCDGPPFQPIINSIELNKLSHKKDANG